jgi:prepilin-type processing-associated H-X9-DG protein
MLMKTLSRECAGFSRVECLTILATAVLLGFLLPAFAQAKIKTIRTQCLDRLSHIGRAFRMYVVDHDGRYPMNVGTNAGGSADYLGTGDTSNPLNIYTHFRAASNYIGRPEFLICPADSGRYVASNWTDFSDNLYAKNAALSYGISIEADISRPRMLLAADRSFDWPNGKIAFEFDGRSLRGNIGTNLTQLRTLGWDPTALHKGVGNLAMADGSVQPVTSEQLRRAINQSGDNRNNYAQPGKSSTM